MNRYLTGGYRGVAEESVSFPFLGWVVMKWAGVICVCRSREVGTVTSLEAVEWNDHTAFGGVVHEPLSLEEGRGGEADMGRYIVIQAGAGTVIGIVVVV